MISKGDTKDLHRHINVYGDGKKIDLPEVEGVVFLNIQSWGAGADAWGTSQDPVSLTVDGKYIVVYNLEFITVFFPYAEFSTSCL